MISSSETISSNESLSITYKFNINRYTFTYYQQNKKKSSTKHRLYCMENFFYSINIFN